MAAVISPLSSPTRARSAVARHRALAWTINDHRPANWRDSVLRCGGGYFHTPGGVQAVAPKGDLLFAQLCLGTDVVGVAAGVRTGCALSLSPRHVYMPTTPALALHAHREAAMAALRDSLLHIGCADLDMDTYDARYEPEADEAEEVVATRMEYLVKLEPCTEEVRKRLAVDHLCCIRRGESEGWRLTITGAADQSGSSVAISAVDGTGCCFGAAAWRGDELLAQAKVGVAGARAYCRSSQATQAGRDSGALTWLQWKIMCQLAGRGIRIYNLGTAPAASATDRPGQDPLRVRLGFAPEMVHARRILWTLSPGHRRAHRMMGWLAGHRA